MGFLSPIFGKGKPLSWLGKEKDKERDPSPPPATAQSVAAAFSSAALAQPEASVPSRSSLPSASSLKHTAHEAADSLQGIPPAPAPGAAAPAAAYPAVNEPVPAILVSRSAKSGVPGVLFPGTQEGQRPKSGGRRVEPRTTPQPDSAKERAVHPDSVSKVETGVTLGIAISSSGSDETSTKVTDDVAARKIVQDQADEAEQHHCLPSPTASTWRSHGSKGTGGQGMSDSAANTCNPLHAEGFGSMNGSEDAGSLGGASGDASGVQSGSAWGVEESARSTVSLPVTALHRRARGRGKSRGSLLYDEVSVQEGDEEGEEDEDDAFSTGQVLDFWAGKRRGNGGRDAMTESGTSELRRAVSSVGRRGDSSMSPRSTSQCHQEQVHPHEHESDYWEGTSSQHAPHGRLPRAPSADSQRQQQAATVWETMTGHLESMRQKQQLQHQSQEDWEGTHTPGGNISPRTEPAPNEQHLSGEGILDGECLAPIPCPRVPKAWEIEGHGEGAGVLKNTLDRFNDKFGGGTERQDAASCADIEMPGHVEAEYGGSERSSDGERDEKRDNDSRDDDDAASGGKLSAMTGMSDTALLHLLLQQENREGEEEGSLSDGDASSDDALSHVPLRNGHVAVSIPGLQLRDGNNSAAKGVPVLDELTSAEEVCGYEGHLGEDSAAREDEEEPQRWAGIFDGLADRDEEEVEGDGALGYGDAEARLREMLHVAEDDECVIDQEQEDSKGGEGDKGEGGGDAPAAGETGRLLGLQAAALEWMKSGDMQKKAAQAQALMALRPDMARVAQWLSVVEPAEPPPDHLWFSTSDATEDPLVKDKQKPAPPPKISSHTHKKPPVAGAPGQSGAAVSAQLAGAMEAAARLLASKDKHLQALYLSAHGLQVVPPSLPAFSHLKTLDLSRNSIANVPSGLLPPSLHILDLSHNRLAAVEGLRDLGRLRLLNLSHNRITRIGHGLVGCTSLRELYLSSNKVGEVEGLHRLLKLQVLDLSSNKVTSTRAVSQLAANEGSLKALNLLSNPIHVNLGNDAFKRFVTGLLPHLQVLNQRPVKATGCARDLIPDSHTSSKGLSRAGHHSRAASTRDLRSKAGSSLSRRHGSTSAFPGPPSTAGSTMRHSKSGAHAAGSSRSRHHKSKESSRVSGTRHHGARLQPVVIPAGMDEQAFQQMLVLQQQQQYLLLQQQQMASLTGQPVGLGPPVPVLAPGDAAAMPAAEHLAVQGVKI